MKKILNINQLKHAVLLSIIIHIILIMFLFFISFKTIINNKSNISWIQNNLSTNDVNNDFLINKKIFLNNFQYKSSRENKEITLNTHNLKNKLNTKKHLVKPEVEKKHLVKPEVEKKHLVKPEVEKKHLVKPEVEKKHLVKPEVEKKHLVKPEVEKKHLVKPEVEKKHLVKPEVEKKHLVKPEVEKKHLVKPEVEKKHLVKPEVEKKHLVKPENNFNNKLLKQIIIKNNNKSDQRKTITNKEHKILGSQENLSSIKYANQLQNAIKNKFYNWENYKGLTCTLFIELSPTGKIINTQIKTGDKNLCEAAIIASYQADIPKPANPNIYKIFKEILLDFNPK